MPPKKTPAKAPAGTPRTVQTRSSRNSLPQKTDTGTTCVSEKKVNGPVKTIRGRAKKQINDKKITPELQELKIKLANEVVQAQFPKQQEFLQKLIVTKPVAKKPLLKRKRVLNKKNIIENVKEVYKDKAEPSQEECECPVVRKRPRIAGNKLKPVVTKENSKDKPAPQKSVEKLTPRRTLSLKRKNLCPSLVRTIVNDYVPDSITQKSTDTPLVVSKPVVSSNICDINTKVPDQSILPIQKSIVDSRRSSLIGSELSWTKDISSSSTTTCVTVASNEFFRFDNRIPVVKITKLSNNVAVNHDKECSSVTEKTTSSSSSTGSNKQSTDCEIISNNNLNLSTSSLSSEHISNSDKTILDKLLEVSKVFNPERLDWIGGSECDANIDEFKAIIKEENVFCDETELLSHWMCISNLVSDEEHNNTLNETVNSNLSANIAETDTVENDTKPDIVFNRDSSKNRIEDDDEDALSLFAESISGFDSSRKNNSFVSAKESPQTEEHVPVVFKQPKPVVYDHTKITELNQSTNRLICEKQSADSTSLRNDFDSDVILNNFESHVNCSDSDANRFDSDVNNFDKDVTNFETDSDSSRSHNSDQRKLKNSNFISMNALPRKRMDLVKSSVLKGVCVFNLIDNCKNVKCNFPHAWLDLTKVKLKLQALSDEAFVREYLLIRNFIQLRRSYGLCYIDECARRKLTRILTEMALDFVLKINDGSNVADEKLKTEAVERTLLYLNYVDLSECDDLLASEVTAGVLLCDVFLYVIGQSQNFSRFRTVFINLTRFMCGVGRVFDCDVAAQIMERICILPYEYSLARTLIEILKRTDAEVFSNCMCGHLEKRLLGSSRHLYEEFVKLKRLGWSRMENEDEIGSVDDVRYSPDTTNFDSKSKRPEDSRTPILTEFSNHYMKPAYHRNWDQTPTPSGGGLFTKKLMFQRPLNSIITNQTFSPSQNPGHIISKLNKKP